MTAYNAWGLLGLISRDVRGADGASRGVLYAFDPLGNVAQRLDATTGEVLSADEYDAYGNLVTGGDPTDPYGYKVQHGYVTDHETGLIYCWHRYYDPAAGRWLTRDPIRHEGGVNLYAYCGGDPVQGVDASGLHWDIVPGIGTVDIVQERNAEGDLRPVLRIRGTWGRGDIGYASTTTGTVYGPDGLPLPQQDQQRIMEIYRQHMEQHTAATPTVRATPKVVKPVSSPKPQGRANGVPPPIRCPPTALSKALAVADTVAGKSTEALAEAQAAGGTLLKAFVAAGDVQHSGTSTEWFHRVDSAFLRGPGTTVVYRPPLGDAAYHLLKGETEKAVCTLIPGQPALFHRGPDFVSAQGSVGVVAVPGKVAVGKTFGVTLDADAQIFVNGGGYAGSADTKLSSPLSGSFCAGWMLQLNAPTPADSSAFQTGPTDSIGVGVPVEGFPAYGGAAWNGAGKAVMFGVGSPGVSGARTYGWKLP